MTPPFEIKGAPVEGLDTVLTQEAVAFIVALQREFNPKVCCNAVRKFGHALEQGRG
jgi:hypothetical protein